MNIMHWQFFDHPYKNIANLDIFSDVDPQGSILGDSFARFRLSFYKKSQIHLLTFPSHTNVCLHASKHTHTHTHAQVRFTTCKAHRHRNDTEWPSFMAFMGQLIQSSQSKKSYSSNIATIKDQWHKIHDEIENNTFKLTRIVLIAATISTRLLGRGTSRLPINFTNIFHMNKWIN